MDPLWSETCWSTLKYFIILIESTYCILCISWIIKCLIIIPKRCKHEDNIVMLATVKFIWCLILYKKWRNEKYFFKLVTTLSFIIMIIFCSGILLLHIKYFCSLWVQNTYSVSVRVRNFGSLCNVKKLTQYCAGDKIEKNEMGWACGAHGWGEGGV